MADELIHVPSGLTTDGLLGRRYLARIIDSVATMVVPSLVLFLFGAASSSVSGSTGAFATTAVLLLFWITYSTVLESSPWQATLGKRWMGLRVYDANGGRLTLRQAAARNLLKDGPFVVLQFLPWSQVLSLALIAAHLFVVNRSPVNQAIHDRVVQTWVAAPEGTIQLRIA